MNKFLMLSLILLNLTQTVWAMPILVQTIPTPQNKPQFSGDLPYISNLAFEKINANIQRDLITEDDTPIEFSSALIYQNKDALSIHVHLEISGGRSYSREKYYVIDLHQHRIMQLKDMLKKYHLSAQKIEQEIAQQLSPCLNPPNSTQTSEDSSYCEDLTLEYLLKDFKSDKNTVQLSKANGFYLKHNLVGISFDSGPYSVTFEYNLKTHRIE